MIELREIRAGYGREEIVSVKHCVFCEGQTAVVVGQNGSGKSTLLRAMAGILPHRGQILLDRSEVRSMPHRERAHRVSFLPQHLTIPDMTVETLVRHGRYSRMGISKILGKQDLDAAERAITLTDIGEIRDRKLGEISGGERQRAYLAMIIAQDAPMILLDEPDTYMDVAHRTELLRILGLLREQGKGIVMTSHDLPLSLMAADRVLVMQEGQITADAEPWAYAPAEVPDASRVGTGENRVSPDICPAAALERAMGIRVRRLRDEGLMFPYALEKNGSDGRERL